ncbi:hypothetical protein Dimus_003148 [Dionaea muscipula]
MDYFGESFLRKVELNLVDDVWWLGKGATRRRDVPAEVDDDVLPTGVDVPVDYEAAEQGESGSDDQFFDAQVDVEEPVTETPATPAVPIPSTVQQKVTETTGVDPSCPFGRILEAVMNKLQAEFERARANRIQDDLEKAQDENARLLAMLQQAQFKPKP